MSFYFFIFLNMRKRVTRRYCQVDVRLIDLINNVIYLSRDGGCDK
jgi:hypothetical protein